MQITIEGEHASIAHDHDAHFTYVISFSERPMLAIGHDDYEQLLIALVKELVKAASGLVAVRHRQTSKATPKWMGTVYQYSKAS